MTPIEHYQPPSAAELAQLKARLKLMSQQMADLVGLAGGSLGGAQEGQIVTGPSRDLRSIQYVARLRHRFLRRAWHRPQLLAPE